MLYNERENIILRQLQLHSTVRVNDLSQMTGVSVDTIRRDLRAMEQRGLIRCVRGGACLPEPALALSNFAGREIINGQLKREASKKALGYIKEGDLIALNSGTTNTVLAQELAQANVRCTVVTNNYAAIDILLDVPSIKLIAVGGELDPLERSSFGTECERQFSQYRPDVAFLSINAVSLSDGFTDFRFGEIGVIQLLAQRAKLAAAVMDSSKFGRCSKRLALELEQVDMLITDDNIDEETRAQYTEKGMAVVF